MKPFAERLLGWWQIHGRRELPWQDPRTPYRVWVSEIMLQQTRVETVIDYFNRFMRRFPDLESLASATIDEVLSLWSGLGYYARARNLHAAANIIRAQHAGIMPSEIEQLLALPGIGQSTAAAIRAQAFHQRAPILDGNAKRVLARHAAIEGWPGQTVIANQLWAEAELRTPDNHAADYTQAIMDLGATVCRRSRPACDQCPVGTDCQAQIQQRQHALPTPKPRKTVPNKTQVFDILRNQDHEILMVRRPPHGIWGGLWCLPEAGSIQYQAHKNLPAPAAIQHAFSHFRLKLEFQQLQVAQLDAVGEHRHQWMDDKEWLNHGIPRPIRQLLEYLSSDSSKQPS